MDVKEVSKFLGGFFGGLTLAHYFLMQSQVVPFTFIDFPVTWQFFYFSWLVNTALCSIFLYYGWGKFKSKKR